jgi:hypothetical protein
MVAESFSFDPRDQTGSPGGRCLTEDLTHAAVSRMALQLHHIFICTSVGAPEAEELLSAGLIEGTPNTHPGQGTANRRFFFESGFLELLWVCDETEARSAVPASANLWDRWTRRNSDASRFGLCFSSTENSIPTMPFPLRSYQPDYLPGHRSLLFADNLTLSEPEIFILGWSQGQSSPESEPTNHPLGLRRIHAASVGLPRKDSISNALRTVRDAGLVDVHEASAPELVVDFVSRKPVQLRVPSLALVVNGCQNP